MTNKPSKPINLFDVQASQKVIGQENFRKAFETILNHGGYAQYYVQFEKHSLS